METATAGRWLYIAKSDAGFGQSGRGTQYGSLGGSWSSQIDLGGSGGASGSGGESTATSFLDRSGNIYYLRASEYGDALYYRKSANAGASWGPPVQAYVSVPGIYTTAAPIGLYVPGFSLGEYVWFAGFGGSENTLRVLPIWTGTQAYSDTGTVRLLGSAGGDLDPGSAFEYNFGNTLRALGGGSYTTAAADLALPGRLLDFGFARAYSSADSFDSGPLGPGWTHSFNWRLAENGTLVTIRRGSGRQDRFTRNQDGSYSSAPGVFDVLTKHTDQSYTLTTPRQTQYEFVGPSQPAGYAAAVLADSPAGYWRLGESSGTSAADAGPNGLTGTYGSGVLLGNIGALQDPSTAASFNGTGNAKVSAGVTGLPTGTSARTVEAWVNPSGNGGTVFTTNAASGQKFIVQIGNFGGSWYLFTDGANGANNITLSGGQVPPTGVWSHIAFVFDGAANTWRYYLNGQQSASGTFPVAINTAALTSTTIGERLDYSQPFSGLLEEVAIYPSALSAARIAAHYAARFSIGGSLTRIHEPAGNQLTLGYSGRNLATITDTVGRQIQLRADASGRVTALRDSSGRRVLYGYDSSGRLVSVWDKIVTSSGSQYATQVLADSPVGYWRLGEASGTVAADASPNHLDGTYSGTLSLNQSGALVADPSAAVTFAGGKVTAGTSGVPTGSGARTVEAWINPTGSGGTIFASNTASGQRFVVQAGQDNGAWYLFSDGLNGANNLTLSGAEIPPAGTWSHVAFVFDGAANTWHYYLNGAATKSGTFAVAINTAAATSTTLGVRLDATQPFSGTLDEVAVYASALSATRIAAHYQANVVAPSWRYTYDGAANHLATITDPDGRVVVTNSYDSLGRLATQKDGLLKTTTFGYGTAQTTVTDPRSHTTTVTYDSRNRPIQQDDPVGGTTYHLYFTYDGCGNQQSVTDRSGNRTDFSYDCFGNLTQRVDPQINPQTPRYTTSWTYDGRNNPNLVTDARGFTTTNSYDQTTNVLLSTSRQIDLTTSAVTKLEYGDAANPGLPTIVTAPRGNTGPNPNHTFATTLSYNSLANLTQKIDADGNKTTFGYDTLGRQTTMVDPDGYATGEVPADHTWTTAYDPNDRVTSSTDPLNHAASTTYDGAGHVASSTDRDGNVTTYTYDNAGRLRTVVQNPTPWASPRSPTPRPSIATTTATRPRSPRPMASSPTTPMTRSTA